MKFVAGGVLLKIVDTLPFWLTPDRNILREEFCRMEYNTYNGSAYACFILLSFRACSSALKMVLVVRPETFG
jgi:hypothetical protein